MGMLDTSKITSGSLWNKLLALSVLLVVVGAMLPWYSSTVTMKKIELEGLGTVMEESTETESFSGLDTEFFGMEGWLVLIMGLLVMLLLLLAWEMYLDMDGPRRDMKLPLIGVFGFFILIISGLDLAHIGNFADDIDNQWISIQGGAGIGIYLVLAGSILLLFAAFMEMRSSCALSSSPTAPEVTVVSSTPAPASISLDSIEASSWGSEEANVATPPLETPISSSASEKDGKIGEGAIEEATTEKPEEREEEKPAKKGLFSKLPFGKKKAAPDTEPTSAGTEHAPEPVLIEPASSEQVESRYKAPETPFAPPVSAIMLKREGKDEEEGNLIRWARHRNTDGKAFEKCMKCDTYQFIEVKEDGKHVNFTCPSCGAKWRLGK